MEEKRKKVRRELDKFNMCVEGARHPKHPTMSIREGLEKSRDMRSSKKIIGALRFEKHKNVEAKYEREVREAFREMADKIVDLLFEELHGDVGGEERDPDWDALLDAYTKRRNADEELKYIEMICAANNE